MPSRQIRYHGTIQQLIKWRILGVQLIKWRITVPVPVAVATAVPVVVLVLVPVLVLEHILEHTRQR